MTHLIISALGSFLNALQTNPTTGRPVTDRGAHAHHASELKATSVSIAEMREIHFSPPGKTVVKICPEMLQSRQIKQKTKPKQHFCDFPETKIGIIIIIITYSK